MGVHQNRQEGIMNFLKLAIPLFATAGLMTSVANANPIVFSGGDGGANSTDPRPNSNATAASFDAAAGALGITSLINFESAPIGTFHSLVVAPGVTLSGTDFTGNSSGQSIRNSPFGSPDRLFGYNTTAGGANFAFINGGFLTFTFASPIDAFGGYISGLQLDRETIKFNDGTNQTITIPNIGSGAGGVQFLGFTDLGKQITSVMLDTRTPSFPLGDFVGVDDVRFTHTAAAVPGPSIGAGLPGLIFASGGLLVWWCRKRRAPSAAV
jgi:hypothetical protein